MTQPATGKKKPSPRRCLCKRHGPPHCTCRCDKPPKPPPEIITTKPNRCQIDTYMSLAEIAYAFFLATGHAVTVMRISAAVRVLQLSQDTKSTTATVKGAVIMRQQTMVRLSEVPRIHTYMSSRI